MAPTTPPTSWGCSGLLRQCASPSRAARDCGDAPWTGAALAQGCAWWHQVGHQHNCERLAACPQWLVFPAPLAPYFHMPGPRVCNSYMLCALNESRQCQAGAQTRGDCQMHLFSPWATTLCATAALSRAFSASACRCTWCFQMVRLALVVRVSALSGACVCNRCTF